MCAQIPILPSFPDHFKALPKVDNVCPALTGSLGVLNGCVCGGAGVGPRTVWGCGSRKARGHGGGWWIAESLQSYVTAFPLVSGALLPGLLGRPCREAQPCLGLSCGPPEGG